MVTFTSKYLYFMLFFILKVYQQNFFYIKGKKLKIPIIFYFKGREEYQVLILLNYKNNSILSKKNKEN